MSGNEGIHRECLQDNIERLTCTLNLKASLILDELVRESCLSEDEAGNIGEQVDRKDQIRKLVVMLSKRSSTNFVKFLEIIQRNNNYPYLAKELQESYDEKISAGRRKAQCLTCVIKRDVSLKDIIDKLFRHRLVDLEYVDLVSANISGNQNANTPHLWNGLFSSIDNASNRRECLQFLKEALAPKYEHIAVKIQFSDQLTCVCGQGTMQYEIASHLSYPTSGGSSYDISTASEESRPMTDRQTSTTGSFCQDLEVDVNLSLPRTFQWVLSSPETDNSKKLSDFANDSSDDQTYVKQPLDINDCEIPELKVEHIQPELPSGFDSNVCENEEIESPDKNTSSLIGIGNSMLLEAGIEESVKESNQLTGKGSEPSVHDTCHLSLGVNHTDSESVSKTTKKKKKRRKKHKSEPTQSHLTKSESRATQRLNMPHPSGYSRTDGAPTLEPRQTDQSADKLAKSIVPLFYEDLKNIKPIDNHSGGGDSDVKCKTLIGVNEHNGFEQNENGRGFSRQRSRTE